MTDVAQKTFKSFPKPSDLSVPAGAEGWEKIYPYYLLFQGNRMEEDDAKFWFCDSQHWPTVFRPFETITGEYAVKCLGQYNARHLLIPNANGIEFKIHLGYLYMSPVTVPEDQIAARVPHFEERAGYYFENWDRLLEGWHGKIRATIAELESLEFKRLPDMVPLEDIHSGKAKDGSEVLMENYDRLIQLCYQTYQYHFEFLNLGYIAYLDFFNFCKQSFPNIPEQSIAAMVQGVDMDLFRPDDELKKLAQLGVELGLQDAFADTDDVAGTLERVGQTGQGEQWLEAYREAQHPWFNFTVGNGMYGHDKYWIEHQEIPLGYIKDYMRRLDGGQQIMRPMEELITERERIISEYRELFSDDDQRATFDAKRQLAATAYPYVENHNFYIEHWSMSVFWRKCRELSRMLFEEGFFEEPEDMFYLGRNEVRDVLFDLVTGWGVGATPTGPSYWPQEIRRRRGIVDALQTQRPQMALNTPPVEITEPFTSMLYGITTEQVNTWLDVDGDSDPNVIRGMAASPGTVEGRVRVVTRADQLGEVQEGEILVASVTAPSWGPIFGKIKATVTDIGGMMSHAAIVCREYALPAVTGTGTASTTLQTGQLVRVDGQQGTVTILED
ncbi:PEP-utilizing enzyme [Citricoccus nitrophenolicus]|uniref:PEP-utilizing enzyme n=1 Tax=Citricoccus nitrophenolicus TaxID=863575 RepID=A0ABV0IIR9_9MICC